jgi:hypothetical protein
VLLLALELGKEKYGGGVGNPVRKVALGVGNGLHHGTGTGRSGGEMRLAMKAGNLTLQRGGSRGIGEEWYPGLDSNQGPID